MAVPRVFVSSTFYDLRHIREAIRTFVLDLGYTPVLSEDGAVYYDPKLSAAEACLSEVASCQLDVLIIGGHYGSEHDRDQSVTRAEYRAAVERCIPTFTLIEAGTLADFKLWGHNRTADAGVDANAIRYPNADDVRIFEFIDEVGQSRLNNAFAPFSHYDDIESYLRQQWAGMFHALLQDGAEGRRVASTLEAVEGISERIEVLTTQILNSVGTEEAKAAAGSFAAMLHNSAVEALQSFGIKIHPSDVLEHPDFDTCAAAFGTVVRTDGEEPGVQITSSGYVSPHRHQRVVDAYSELRQRIQAIVREAGLTAAQLREQEMRLVV